MKKAAVFLILFALLLQPLAVFAVDSAEREAVADDRLVIHYDFHGATVSEALSDKASGGSVKDDLGAFVKPSSGSAAAIPEETLAESFRFDASAGTVTSLADNVYLRGTSPDDLKFLKNGTATFFFRFRLEQLPAKGTYVYLLDLRDKWGAGGQKFRTLTLRVNEIGAVALSYCDSGTQKEAVRNIVGMNSICAGVYYNLTVTMETADGATAVTTRLSQGAPTAEVLWKTASSVNLPIDFSQFADREFPAGILNYYAGSNDTYGGCTLDDLRIYNAALTAAEIAAIIPSGSFDLSLDDYLVTHYDFSGKTAAEALTDKASGGSSADTLVGYTKDGYKTLEADALEPYFTLNSQKGTVRADQNLSCLRAKASGDVRFLADGNATFFVRFRLDALPNEKYATLLDLRDKWNNGGQKFRSLILQVLPTGAVALGYCDASGAAKTENLVGQNTVHAGVYYNLAVSVSTDETGTVLRTYLSAGLPTEANMKLVSTKALSVDFSLFAARTVEYGLFSYYPGDADSRSVGLTLDDVRIYSKPLDAAEVSSAFANGVFDTVHTVGVQTRQDANRYDVRFVAILDDIADVDRVGFEVVLSYTDSDGNKRTSQVASYDSSTVYTAIAASADGKLVRYTAEELGGNYIVALAVEHIPNALGNVTVTVKPYLSSGGTRIYGAVKTVICNAGALA